MYALMLELEIHVKCLQPAANLIVSKFSNG